MLLQTYDMFLSLLLLYVGFFYSLFFSSMKTDKHIYKNIKRKTQIEFIVILLKDEK